MKRILQYIFFITLISASTVSFGQEEKSDEIKNLSDKISYIMPGNSKFLLRGYAHSGLEYVPDSKMTFVGGAFNPLFIYRQSDRLLFESELETSFEEDKFDVGLEYANMSYIITKTMTLRLGKIFVPFGIFVDRLHPAWINKFPNTPLGFGHDGVLPGTDLGIEIRGGAYAGNLKYNYSFYVVNGPQLNTGEDHADDAGKLDYGIAFDNGFNKSFGTRIGLLPFSNSSLEVGFSAMIGNVGARGTEYEKVGSQLYAVDLTYVKTLNFMQSMLDVRAQASWVNVDDADYPVPDDPGQVYTFTNKSNTFFGQVSIRPAYVSAKFIKNLEFAVRYSDLNTPEGAMWETNTERWDYSLNYWIDWRTVIKFSYQSQSGGDHNEDAGEDAAGSGNAFFLHWAIGF